MSNVNSKSPKIRLSSFQIDGIVKAIETVFQKHSLALCEGTLFLYGSRVDIEKKGGDIDLLFEISDPVFSQCRLLESELLVQMKINIGDQKIDLLIRKKNASLTPFEKIALQSKEILKQW